MSEHHSVWRHLSNAIFTGDRAWAWRRRTVFAGCAVALGGIAHATYFDHDLAHATMVMNASWLGYSATLATYLGLAVTDEHLKRETERKAEAVPVRTEAAVAAQGVKS